MNTKRYLKKKPWKNLNSFSKAVKKIFSHLKSFPSSISPTKSSDEPKSFYSPITSRYECSCGYHRRQREEQWRFGDDFMQQHHETAEEIHLHGKGSYGIYEWKDEKENGDNLLSTNDASAFVNDLKQDNDAVCDVLEFADDVDERAEKFIRQIREQWRI